jgi:hypothetical protein
MAEQEEQWPEGVFEIIWHQHNPDDWMAEVRDTRSNQICQVFSLEELERFIRAHLRVGEPQPAEPKK